VSSKRWPDPNIQLTVQQKLKPSDLEHRRTDDSLLELSVCFRLKCRPGLQSEADRFIEFADKVVDL
jgi:hypothetical protein